MDNRMVEIMYASDRSGKRRDYGGVCYYPDSKGRINPNITQWFSNILKTKVGNGAAGMSYNIQFTGFSNAGGNSDQEQLYNIFKKYLEEHKIPFKVDIIRDNIKPYTYDPTDPTTTGKGLQPPFALLRGAPDPQNTTSEKPKLGGNSSVVSAPGLGIGMLIGAAVVFFL